MAASLWRSEGRSEKLLRLGRRQLESLRREGHPYGDARVRSLHRLLAEGGGLPLLFPEHDVGFAYREGAVLANKKSPPGPATSSSGRSFSAAPEGPGGASFPSTSAVRLGGRMPHFILRPSESGAGDGGECKGGCVDGPTQLLSTVDLPDQIRGFLLSRLRSQVPARSAAGSCGDVEGGSANETDIAPSRGAAEASRLSLAAVLIVALPSDATARSSHTDFDGDAAVIAAAAAAAETARARWRAAAISAQREFGAEQVTAEHEEGRRSPCPLVVLTVCPPPRESTSPKHRGGFAGEGETSAPAKGKAEGLVRDGDGRRTSSSSSGDGEEPWRLGTIAPIDHLERFLDGDDSVESMPPAQRWSAGALKPSVGEGGSGKRGLYDEGCGSPGLVLSMRAIDDDDGNLGEAFATAGAEALLIRPDGHIAWVGQRRNTRDETGEEVDRARDLGRALDAVFAGRRCVQQAVEARKPLEYGR